MKFDIDNRWHVRAYIFAGLLAIALVAGAFSFALQVLYRIIPWFIYPWLALMVFIGGRKIRSWWRARGGSFRARWLRRRIWRWRWNRFKYRLNPDPEYEAYLEEMRKEFPKAGDYDRATKGDFSEGRE